MSSDIIITRQFVNDIREIVNNGIATASSAVANAAIFTYWNIGKRIVEDEHAGLWYMKESSEEIRSVRIITKLYHY